MNLARLFDTALAGCELEDFPVEQGELTEEGGPGGAISIAPSLLQRLSARAFADISRYLSPHQLECLARLKADSDDANEIFVLESLLENAALSAGGILPLCQDTGTATVFAVKDEGLVTGGGDIEALEEGAGKAWREAYLRASQFVPDNIYAEHDSGTNLPAQIQIETGWPATAQGPRYRFLFTAKGGGSANKTSLFQMTKALLDEAKLKPFLLEKTLALGTSACPPYHLAVVIGGTSAEENLKMQKLASSGLFAKWQGEELPLRDRALEDWLLDTCAKEGPGAQFGGRAFLASATVLRLSRHAASLPVSIGVACVAHRSMLAEISSNGVRVERLVHDVPGFMASLERTRNDDAQGGRVQTGGPAESSPSGSAKAAGKTEAVPIDLSKGMEAVLAALRGLPVGTRLSLSGPLLVARDAAHLRWHQLIASGKELPSYTTQYPIYYAGPARTPPDHPVGSLGPTTALRMDEYADELMARGASLVTLAKGNRTKALLDACKQYGGFYLGTIGGAAALLASKNVLSSRVIDYEDLGMEAVRLIEVKDLAAFVLVDDGGKSLY